MTDTLPGLALAPLTIADILRRVETRAAQPPAPDPTPALPLPVARPRTGGVPGDAKRRAWHRHELGGGAYELRAHGRAFALVTPHPSGWRIAHIGASSTATRLTAAEADALAARIARMVTAG